MPYIFVLNCEDSSSEKEAVDFLKNKTRRCTTKSKSVREGNVELNMEVRLKDDNTDFVNEISRLGGVKNAVLVSYNGDYMG